MQYVIMKILKGLLAGLIAKPMLIWGARWLAKLSDTKIDDEVVEACVAAYEGDLDKTQKALQEALDSIKKELFDKDNQ